FAVSIALPDEANAWSGIGEIELDGKTFIGVGSLAGISVVSEKADGSAGGITLTLSGIDPDFTQYLIEQPYRGARVDLYIGTLDEGFAQVNAWKKIPVWRINAVSVTEDENGVVVTAECESVFIDQTR